MSTLLTFINRTDIPSEQSIFLLQRNNQRPATKAIIWQLIERLGPNGSHPVAISQQLQISAKDDQGNFTPILNAMPGQLFQMILRPSGHEMGYKGLGEPGKIQLQNNLARNKISGMIYRDGVMLDQVSFILPGQTVSFQFDPILTVGVGKNLREGQALDSCLLEQATTDLSLKNLISADVIITGGPDPEQYCFSMENEILT